VTNAHAHCVGGLFGGAVPNLCEPNVAAQALNVSHRPIAWQKVTVSEALQAGRGHSQNILHIFHMSVYRVHPGRPLLSLNLTTMCKLDEKKRKGKRLSEF
jgi:hypothetical protein